MIILATITFFARLYKAITARYLKKLDVEWVRSVLKSQKCTPLKLASSRADLGVTVVTIVFGRTIFRG